MKEDLFDGRATRNGMIREEGSLNVLVLERIEDIAIRVTSDDELHDVDLIRQLFHHLRNGDDNILSILTIIDGIKDNDDWSREMGSPERSDEQFLKLIVQGLLGYIRLHVERTKNLDFEILRAIRRYANLVGKRRDQTPDLGGKDVEDAAATEEEATEQGASCCATCRYVLPVSLHL